VFEDVLLSAAIVYCGKIFTIFVLITYKYTAHKMTSVEKNSDNARAVPETELASVVLHAGEMSDVTYLKDYIQVIIYTFADSGHWDHDVRCCDY